MTTRCFEDNSWAARAGAEDMHLVSAYIQHLAGGSKDAFIAFSGNRLVNKTQDEQNHYQ